MIFPNKSIDNHRVMAQEAGASDFIVIAAQRQTQAEAIKLELSLRDQELLAIDFNSLGQLDRKPGLLVYVLSDPAQRADALAWVLKVPTLVLQPDFDEEFFLACHDSGAWDVLTQPVSSAYLLSKILDGLKRRQQSEQLNYYSHLLTRLGAISERSGLLSTPMTLSALDEAINAYCLDPQKNVSLVALQCNGMPSPCAKSLEKSLYQQIAHCLKSSMRGGDIAGELMEEKLLVIMPDTSIEGANALAGRILKKLKGQKDLPKNLAFQWGASEYQPGQHYESWLKQTLSKLIDWH